MTERGLSNFLLPRNEAHSISYLIVNLATGGGVIFTNILRVAFSFKSFAQNFFDLHFRFVLFWRKNICVKAARKMLVKLTSRRGVIFINKFTLTAKVLAHGRKKGFGPFYHIW